MRKARPQKTLKRVISILLALLMLGQIGLSQPLFAADIQSDAQIIDEEVQTNEEAPTQEVITSVPTQAETTPEPMQETEPTPEVETPEPIQETEPTQETEPIPEVATPMPTQEIVINQETSTQEIPAPEELPQQATTFGHDGKVPNEEESITMTVESMDMITFSSPPGLEISAKHTATQPESISLDTDATIDYYIELKNAGKVDIINPRIYLVGEYLDLIDIGQGTTIRDMIIGYSTDSSARTDGSGVWNTEEWDIENLFNGWVWSSVTGLVLDISDYIEDDVTNIIALNYVLGVQDNPRGWQQSGIEYDLLATGNVLFSMEFGFVCDGGADVGAVVVSSDNKQDFQLTAQLSHDISAWAEDLPLTELKYDSSDKKYTQIDIGNFKSELVSELEKLVRISYEFEINIVPDEGDYNSVELMKRTEQLRLNLNTARYKADFNFQVELRGEDDWGGESWYTAQIVETTATGVVYEQNSWGNNITGIKIKSVQGNEFPFAELQNSLVTIVSDVTDLDGNSENIYIRGQGKKGEQLEDEFTTNWKTEIAVRTWYDWQMGGQTLSGPFDMPISKDYKVTISEYDPQIDAPTEIAQTGVLAVSSNFGGSLPAEYKGANYAKLLGDKPYILIDYYYQIEKGFSYVANSWNMWLAGQRSATNKVEPEEVEWLPNPLGGGILIIKGVPLATDEAEYAFGLYVDRSISGINTAISNTWLAIDDRYETTGVSNPFSFATALDAQDTGYSDGTSGYPWISGMSTLATLHSPKAIIVDVKQATHFDPSIVAEKEGASVGVSVPGQAVQGAGTDTFTATISVIEDDLKNYAEFYLYMVVPKAGNSVEYDDDGTITSSPSSAFDMELKQALVGAENFPNDAVITYTTDTSFTMNGLNEGAADTSTYVLASALSPSDWKEVTCVKIYLPTGINGETDIKAVYDYAIKAEIGEQHAYSSLYFNYQIDGIWSRTGTDYGVSKLNEYILEDMFIEGTFWNDDSGYDDMWQQIGIPNNGIWDAGEIGFPHVEVELLHFDGTDYMPLSPSSTATTDNKGKYKIAVPGIGNYQIRIINEQFGHLVAQGTVGDPSRSQFDPSTKISYPISVLSNTPNNTVADINGGLTQNWMNFYVSLVSQDGAGARHEDGCPNYRSISSAKCGWSCGNGKMLSGEADITYRMEMFSEYADVEGIVTLYLPKGVMPKSTMPEPGLWDSGSTVNYNTIDLEESGPYAGQYKVSAEYSIDATWGSFSLEIPCTLPKFDDLVRANNIFTAQATGTATFLNSGLKGTLRSDYVTHQIEQGPEMTKTATLNPAIHDARCTNIESLVSDTSKGCTSNCHDGSTGEIREDDNITYEIRVINKTNNHASFRELEDILPTGVRALNWSYGYSDIGDSVPMGTVIPLEQVEEWADSERTNYIDDAVLKADQFEVGLLGVRSGQQLCIRINTTVDAVYDQIADENNYLVNQATAIHLIVEQGGIIMPMMDIPIMIQEVPIRSNYVTHKITTDIPVMKLAVENSVFISIFLIAMTFIVAFVVIKGKKRKRGG